MESLKKRQHLARYFTSLVSVTLFTERKRDSVDINLHLCVRFRQYNAVR